MSTTQQVDAPKARAGKRILSSGHNTALLRLRNSFIQTAGYHVVTTKESELLLDMARRQDFAAAVLCSSIPSDIQEHLVRELKKIRPGMPVIAICSRDSQDRLKGIADRIVLAEHGVSQPLMEAVFEFAGDPDE